ncbi:interferon alpha/beta receptor 1 [Rhineura floridana]|uniref:interferon alpha/beta receptor 1 n=1 Tax=Rhineura floridana TaxID=261503 RepID=UPI002AC89030|nr:interferon alpha/beta receptor 1 [Rhineura floridana]
MKPAGALLVVVAALGIAPPCTGLTCLEQPRNVTVYVVNTNITLKWVWDNPCDLNVTFSVQYQEESGSKERNRESWSLISECQNVRITECDLSSALSEDRDYNVSIRASTGEDQSPWASLIFCPYLEAQIGPPGVQLESIYGGDVKITIFHPEANQQRRMWELSSLRYKLTLWKNSSYPEEKKQDVFSGETIPDLEPETIYCLKVKAHQFDRIALYSPNTCIQTQKAWAGLPRPKNLRLHALNMNFILHWDNIYDVNVSFVVQWLSKYEAERSPDISENWLNVSGCENIPTTYCDVSRSISFIGIYYLRVQALNSHNKSPWSKMLKFEPREDIELGPPSVKVNATENSLNIFIASPGESENTPMSKEYSLTYRVWYWTNSSYAKKKREDKPMQFTISGLNPSTLYCLQVQAFAQAYNKNSEFSNVTCIETTKGESSYQLIIVVLGIILAVGAFVAILAGSIYCIWRQIKYAFFPSCHPPMIIESIGGKYLNSSYLLTSEEPTEDCVVITDNSIPNGVDLPDFKDPKELEEISQDSGNYSNEDGISRTKEYHITQEQKAV